MAVTAPVHTRQRRRPEDAEREILAAAETLLGEAGYRTLTVADLMAHTGLGRSSFYMYFRDIPDLLRRMLQQIEGELFAVAQDFLAGDGDVAEGCMRSCAGIVAVHLRHGPILRAVSRTLTGESEVEISYRDVAIEHFVDAVADRVAGEVARGRMPGPVPREVARALVLMTNIYLGETLGKVPHEDPKQVTETLAFVWRRTLYGTPSR